MSSGQRRAQGAGIQGIQQARGAQPAGPRADVGQGTHDKNARSQVCCGRSRVMDTTAISTLSKYDPDEWGHDSHHVPVNST